MGGCVASKLMEEDSHDSCATGAATRNPSTPTQEIMATPAVDFRTSGSSRSMIVKKRAFRARAKSTTRRRRGSVSSARHSACSRFSQELQDQDTPVQEHDNCPVDVENVVELRKRDRNKNSISTTSTSSGGDSMGDDGVADLQQEDSGAKMNDSSSSKKLTLILNASMFARMLSDCSTPEKANRNPLEHEDFNSNTEDNSKDNIKDNKKDSANSCELTLSWEYFQDANDEEFFAFRCLGYALYGLGVSAYHKSHLDEFDRKARADCPKLCDRRVEDYADALITRMGEVFAENAIFAETEVPSSSPEDDDSSCREFFHDLCMENQKNLLWHLLIFACEPTGSWLALLRQKILDKSALLKTTTSSAEDVNAEDDASNLFLSRSRSSPATCPGGGSRHDPPGSLQRPTRISTRSCEDPFSLTSSCTSTTPRTTAAAAPLKINTAAAMAVLTEADHLCCIILKRVLMEDLMCKPDNRCTLLDNFKEAQRIQRGILKLQGGGGFDGGGPPKTGKQVMLPKKKVSILDNCSATRKGKNETSDSGSSSKVEVGETHS